MQRSAWAVRLHSALANAYLRNKENDKSKEKLAKIDEINTAAGASAQNSVVDTNCMSHDIENLMCCDASVIPNHISANPNATIMAVASRASEYVITNILGQRLPAAATGEQAAEAVVSQ